MAPSTSRRSRPTGEEPLTRRPSQTLNEIMPMIYRRFTEKSAEEWLQIYKALQLLEFLVKHGSERVIDDARGHITLLKMLRQFHYIDQNGKDQGINVRNRSKELAELLGDVDRIRAERKKARASKNKYTGVEGGMGHGGAFSSGGGRFGGFGSDSGYGGGGSSASYGGYSGGVYGDGGGFGGQTSDFRDSGGRSVRFDEYDEFDEDERPAASSSRPARKTERKGVKKTTGEPPKKKEPEVDLFSFDDPSPAPAAPAAPAASNGSGLATLAGPSGSAANDDDEFDDFQSAAPAQQPAAASAGLGQPLSPPPISTASSTAQFAAPQTQSVAQRVDLGHMVSASSTSPGLSTTATPGANYSALMGAPQQAPPPRQTGFQPSDPNYFGAVQSQGGQPKPMPAPSMAPMSGMTSPTSGPTTMANMKPVPSSAAKPAGGAASGGSDAFGALWGKASAGIKKAPAASPGPAMGQLAKEKSSAGIWGAPAAKSSQPSTGGGPASGDLLG